MNSPRFDLRQRIPLRDRCDYERTTADRIRFIIGAILVAWALHTYRVF